MDPKEPFRGYSAHLQEKYGRRVYRVSVDAGFSCPNRGPDRGRPGCTYCEEAGARAPYLGDLTDLRRQVERSIGFLQRRYRARGFLLYFQAFSGTHAPVERLKEIYDACLQLAPFHELIVSTRPDCLDPATADLLASYRRPGLEVWVELGLQSASEETLRRIRRGHSVDDFRRAWRLLKERRIPGTVHLIFGLPGEGREEILHTTRFVADLQPEGVKIHNLNICLGTPLYDEYLLGEISAPCADRHLEYVIEALELLPPETVIMRLTCDTPAHRLAAPRTAPDKPRFYESVRREMRRRGVRQGCRYRQGCRHPAGLPSEQGPADASRRYPTRVDIRLDPTRLIRYHGGLQEGKVAVKDSEILGLVEKISTHYHANINNRFMRKALLVLKIPRSAWENLERLTGQVEHYRVQGYQFRELYEQIHAAALFIHHVKMEILPNLRGLLAGSGRTFLASEAGKPDMDRVLREMAVNNFGSNLAILTDLVNELYVKTVGLDKAENRNRTAIYEKMPELKEIGQLLI